MKIQLNRAEPEFWGLYLLAHFSFLLVVLFAVRWVWSLMVGRPEMPDLAELTFECSCYAVLITFAKHVRYRIGKLRKAPKQPAAEKAPIPH